MPTCRNCGKAISTYREWVEGDCGDKPSGHWLTREEWLQLPFESEKDLKKIEPSCTEEESL